MRKLYYIIRRNRLYALLAAGILAVNALVFVTWLRERPEPATEAVSVNGEIPAGSRKLFDHGDMEAKQEKIAALSGENPILYFMLVVVNLKILFLILLGFILDCYLGVRSFRKEPLDLKLAETEKPRWTLADIVKVALIFLSAGYMFAIVQSFAAGAFPLFGNPNFRMVFDTALMSIAGIAVIFYFVRKKYAHNIRAIGLGKVNIVKGVLIGLAGYIAFIPAFLLIMLAVYFTVRWIGYEPPVQPIVEVFMEEEKTVILGMSAVFAAVFGPITEEIFFRGFMYPAAREKWGKAAGIIGTSVLFSFLHAHAAGFLPIMALGILLTYLYERTGTLVVPVVVHITHNLGMVGLVFLMRTTGV